MTEEEMEYEGSFSLFAGIACFIGAAVCIGIGIGCWELNIPTVAKVAITNVTGAAAAFLAIAGLNCICPGLGQAAAAVSEASSGYSDVATISTATFNAL